MLQKALPANTATLPDEHSVQVRSEAGPEDALPARPSTEEERALPAPQRSHEPPFKLKPAGQVSKSEDMVATTPLGQVMLTNGDNTTESLVACMAAIASG